MTDHADGAEPGQPSLPPTSRTRSLRRRLVLVGLAGLIALTGWLGWHDVQLRRAEQQRAEMLQAARAGVVALTTVDHERVDEDVQRILDSSAGSFRDEFDQRAASFKEAARKAQSKSVGTVTEAGVESVDGDQGSVLVAMTVMNSNRGVPERQPKAWRTRVTVNRVDGGYKLTAVEFVR